MDVDKADAEVEVAAELEPRRDVAVVIEARHEDLVAGRECPSESAREREVEGRHVLAEDRLRGPAAEEAGRGRVRQLDQLVAAAAGGERSTEVRVGLAEIRGDRVDHRSRTLRAAGGVEEGDAGVERGELCPDSLQIDGRGRHLSLLERRQRQPMLAQLLPVELGLLAEAGPDDGPPRVVDPVGHPHPVVVRDARDDRRERGFAVREEPTKQSRSASARSSASASGSGSGASSTTSSTSVSTSAYRSSISRFVTRVRLLPEVERTSTPLRSAW